MDKTCNFITSTILQGDSPASDRLRNERKKWRKDHPTGFWAKPSTKNDGSLDLLTWTAGIPGKKGTDWEKGVYKLQMFFRPDYPIQPPKCRFSPVILHPNVYRSGDVCLSILGQGWKPSVTICQILLGIQDLLDNPNWGSPASSLPCGKNNPTAYKKMIREQAKKFAND